VGYAFNPGAVCLVGRKTEEEGSLGSSQYVIDPVSGIGVLVSRLPLYHAEQFEVSCLWGLDILDPRKGCRIARSTS
jgi:hypothetical protein